MIKNYLKCDEQTLKDLNLSSLHNAGKNVFDILGKAKSLGGQSFLRAYFKQPYMDAYSIQKRQTSIQYFQQHPMKLSFSLAELDHMEYYLNTDINSVSSRNRIGRWVQGMNYRINHSGSHYFLKESLKHAIHCFSAIQDYTDKQQGDQLPEELVTIFQELQNCLQTDIFMQLTAIRSRNVSIQQLYKLDQLIRDEHIGTVRNFLDQVYKLDALNTLAKETRALGWRFPEIEQVEHSVLQIQALYHPLLHEAIPNDFELGKTNHLLFLTGPNMAGKTTFLKALGIAVYLGQLGLPVPAQKMRFTPFRTLITSIHTRDRLDKGYSFFYSEVQRVKDAALALSEGSHVLLIFNELFKGTNVEDAYDASQKIISSFAQHQNNLFVLSSHLLELAPKLEHLPGIMFQHFESSVEQGKPAFSYKIKDGVSSQRLGMLILENEGVLEILEKARISS